MATTTVYVLTDGVALFSGAFLDASISSFSSADSLNLLSVEQSGNVM